MPPVTAASTDNLAGAPGVVVGILLIFAAIVWFSPVARVKVKRITMVLVIAAIALIVIFGYLRPLASGCGA